MGGEMGAYGEGAAGNAPLETIPGGPTGSGWVIEIRGYHYHNYEDASIGSQRAQYVRNTLIESLRNAKVALPRVDADGKELVSLKELGVGYPALINPGTAEKEVVDLKPTDSAPRGEDLRGSPSRPSRHDSASPDDSERNQVELLRFDFTIHFCWQPITPTERHEKEQQAEQSQPDGEQPPEVPPAAAPPI